MTIQEKLREIEAVIQKGPYQDTWASLSQYEIPKWYWDAKFGIFIHWGVYSVPAFGNEWYPRNMYQKGTPEYEHHLKTYGPLTLVSSRAKSAQITPTTFTAPVRLRSIVRNGWPVSVNWWTATSPKSSGLTGGFTM